MQEGRAVHRADLAVAEEASQRDLTELTAESVGSGSDDKVRTSKMCATAIAPKFLMFSASRQAINRSTVSRSGSTAALPPMESENA